jgi:hypothetical protein
VVSDDAVGIEVDGQMFSIAYDDCVATMWWQDGARSLIGVRGEELRLVPWRWVDADVAFAEVDAHVAVLHTAPSGVTLSPLVPMTGPSPGAPPPRDPRSAHRRVTWVFALLALASTLFAAGFLVLSPDLSDEDSRRAGVVGECDGVPTFSFLFGDGVDQVDDERSQLCDDAAGDNVVGAVLCLVFGLVFGALAVREGVLAHRSSGFSAPGPPLLRDPPPGPRVDGVGEPLLDAAPD